MNYEINIVDGVTKKNRKICELYWLRDKDGFVHSVKELGDIHGIKSYEITKIVKKNASIIFTDFNCVGCSAHKVCFTRSDITTVGTSDWQCNVCKNRENELMQKALLKKRIAEKIKKQEAINKKKALLERIQYKKLSQVIKIKKLSIVTQYLLGAVIESLGLDNLSGTVSLMDNQGLGLSPHSQLDIKILKTLHKENVIVLDIEKSHEVVIFDNHEKPIIDFFKANFFFVYELEELTELYRLINTNTYSEELISHPDYLNWIIDITLAECIVYLVYRSQLNGLYPTIGEKMANLFKLCLQDFSVSETWYFIWGAVESAAAYYQKPNITKKHASNAIYGNIRRRYEKTKCNELKLLSFKRDKHVKQTAISIIMIDLVHGKRDIGFNRRINTLDKGTRYTEFNYTKLGNISLVTFLKKNYKK